MGAGRGKTRRAQAQTTQRTSARHKITFDENKWAEFISLSGIAAVNVAEYYFDDKDALDMTTMDESLIKLAYVFREILADAVTSGAVSFDPKIAPNDLRVRVADHPNRRMDAIQVYNNADGDLILETWVDYSCFDPNGPITMDEIGRFLKAGFDFNGEYPDDPYWPQSEIRIPDEDFSELV